MQSIYEQIDEVLMGGASLNTSKRLGDLISVIEGLISSIGDKRAELEKSIRHYQMPIFFLEMLDKHPVVEDYYLRAPNAITMVSLDLIEANFRGLFFLAKTILLDLEGEKLSANDSQDYEYYENKSWELGSKISDVRYNSRVFNSLDGLRSLILSAREVLLDMSYDKTIELGDVVEGSMASIQLALDKFTRHGVESSVLFYRRAMLIGKEHDATAREYIGEIDKDSAELMMQSLLQDLNSGEAKLNQMAKCYWKFPCCKIVGETIELPKDLPYNMSIGYLPVKRYSMIESSKLIVHKGVGLFPFFVASGHTMYVNDSTIQVEVQAGMPGYARVMALAGEEGREDELAAELFHMAWRFVMRDSIAAKWMFIGGTDNKIVATGDVVVTLPSKNIDVKKIDMTDWS